MAFPFILQRQQISSMFDDLNEENHDDIKSDHSSGIFYQEPVSSILIKKNEILAEKLNIAGNFNIAGSKLLL